MVTAFLSGAESPHRESEVWTCGLSRKRLPGPLLTKYFIYFIYFEVWGVDQG